MTETSTQYTDVRYAYDVLGRLSTVTVDEANGVTLASPLVTTYAYTPTGNIASIVQANGVVTDYTYDSLNRLIGITDTNASGTLLDEYKYVLDADGRCVSAAEFELQSNGVLDEVKINWTFDALGRMTSEDSLDATGLRPALSYDTTYTYDLDSNLVATTTKSASGTTTVNNTYNPDGELVETTTTSGPTTLYTYDANGSLIEQQTNGQPAAAYAYDLQNRLVNATLYSTNSSGKLVATATTYTYDFAGNLVGEQTTVTVAGVYQSSTGEVFVNDAQNPSGYSQILETRGTSGIPSATYVIGNRSARLARSSYSGEAQFIETDALGSTRVLTGATGQILDSFDYTAYGLPLDFNAPSAATIVLFGGQDFDAGSDEYYMRARFYDPSTGQVHHRRHSPRERRFSAYVQRVSLR